MIRFDHPPDRAATLRRVLFALLAIAGALLVLQLVAVALAQTGDPLTSFPQWGSNPLIFVPGLVAVVGILRARLFSRVDGKIPVFLLASGAGVAIGAAFQLVGMLAVAPFAGWAVPWGGIAYGEAAAVTGFLGMNLFDLFAARNAQAKASADLAIAPLKLTGGGTANPVQSFILVATQAAVSALKLPAALTAVLPLLKEFASSEAVLTDDLRSSLQARVLTLLRKAGLAGVDL